MEDLDFCNATTLDAVPTRSGWPSAFFSLDGLHGRRVSVGLIWLRPLAIRLAVKGATQAGQVSVQILDGNSGIDAQRDDLDPGQSSISLQTVM